MAMGASRAGTEARGQRRRPTRRYVDLILYKTYAELKAESQRTYIGFLWWIIEPVINMLVFYVVFKLILHRGTEDFVPFLLIGVITWKWFQTTVRGAAVQVPANKTLMRQVYLPKFVLPSTTILKDTCKFLVAFLMLMAFLWVYGFRPGAPYLALPVLLLIHLLLIAALAYPLAAVYPFVPDLLIPIDHALQVAFYLSGVFYAGASLPDGLRPYFYLNPMANLIEAYREVLMYDRWPDGSGLVWIGSFSVAGIVAGNYLLRRYDRLYPRVAS